MKIVILTGKFGMGHYMAAQAVKEELIHDFKESEIELIDWLDYTAPKYSGQIYQLFTFLVNKGSLIYNQRYKLLENGKINRKPELCHFFLKQFQRLLEEKQPDIIITTLPTCAQVVSVYKEKKKLELPLLTCVTDITGHSEWINRNTDYYFVGSADVKDKLIQKGVLPQSIYITGIPVRQKFYIKGNEIITKGEKIPRKKKILIMGGGLGILPENVNFYDKLNHLVNCEVTIITGTNREVYEKLINKYRNITVLGYTPNTYDYMRNSDVVITKPGGITTFEAIQSETPILALNPFLQQEVYNAEFIQKHHIGAVIKGNDKLGVEEIEALVQNDGLLKEFRDNMKVYRRELENRSLDVIIHKVIADKRRKDCAIVSYPFRNRKEEVSLHEKVNFNL